MDQARPLRVNGIDCGTSQARFGNSREKAHGNSMETPRGKATNSPCSRSAQRIDERIHQDFKLTELKLNPHRTKTPPHFDSQKLMEKDGKEFFQREEVDRKWKKKEEPDSA